MREMLFLSQNFFPFVALPLFSTVPDAHISFKTRLTVALFTESVFANSVTLASPSSAKVWMIFVSKSGEFVIRF